MHQQDMYQMYAYSKKYNTPEIWLLYPVNDEMRKHKPIQFESGDGTTVNLHFIDVDKIEESLKKLKGKLEEGETPKQALKREIEEELDTKIEVYDLIDTIEYDYSNFHLSMDCFWCETITGKLVLKEAEAAKWLSKDELESVQWLPADLTLVEKIRRSMSA